MRGFNFLHSFGLVVFGQSSNNYVRFPAIGDWGGSDYIIFPDGNTFAQEFGAASMGSRFYQLRFFDILDRLCGEKECDFLLSLGDNFYTEGVTDIEDTRFHFTYELVYGKASEREVLKTLDFYQCLGNHDHKDNATAQVSFNEKSR
jgi:tartrate-resistant acid phosphatase type 5